MAGSCEGNWEEQYKQERGMHMVGILLAVRGELMSLLEDMPALVRSRERLPDPLEACFTSVMASDSYRFVSIRETVPQTCMLFCRSQRLQRARS